jgi:hypothetical protein
MATPQETWIPKARAAELLGLSVREVERMAQNGRIQKRYDKPGPGRRYGCVLYREADVLAIEEEREVGIHNSGGAQAKQNLLTLLPASQVGPRAVEAQVDAWGALTAHLAKLSAAFPTPTNRKAWLTLEEAAEHSGLPVAKLTELVSSEVVYAIGRGPKTWRIQRASLDAFGEAAMQ